jgi:two-component system nitrogen regulation response regulator GlnG
MIRRLCVLYAQETIDADVIDAELREGLPNGALAVGDGEEGLGGAVARHLELLFERPDGGMPQAGLHGRIVREVERPLIAKVLAATRGNQLQAAAVLGLNRNTLRKKIRELDIEVMRGPR